MEQTLVESPLEICNDLIKFVSFSSLVYLLNLEDAVKLSFSHFMLFQSNFLFADANYNYFSKVPKIFFQNLSKMS